MRQLSPGLYQARTDVRPFAAFNPASTRDVVNSADFPASLMHARSNARVKSVHAELAKEAVGANMQIAAAARVIGVRRVILVVFISKQNLVVKTAPHIGRALQCSAQGFGYFQLTTVKSVAAVGALAHRP